MKFFAFEVARIGRARFLPSTVIFLFTALLAWAVNEYGFRYAGSSQLTVEVREIVRDLSYTSSVSGSNCEGCVLFDDDRIVSAVQSTVASTIFWENVADTILTANGGETPNLYATFLTLYIDQLIGSVDTTTHSYSDLVRQLAQLLRSSISSEIVDEGSDLRLTLKAADRSYAALVFEVLDDAVRNAIVQLLTRQLQWDLTAHQMELGILRAFQDDRAIEMSALDVDELLSGRGDISAVVSQLRAASANLNAILNLDGILQGDLLERSIVSEMNMDLVPVVADAIAEFTTGMIGEAELRDRISNQSSYISTVRGQLMAEVEALRAEAALLLDELQLYSTLAINQQALAHYTVQVARDEARISSDIAILNEIIDQMQATILSTSRYSHFQYSSGANIAIIIALVGSFSYLCWHFAMQFGKRTITSADDIRDLSLAMLGEVPEHYQFSKPIAAAGDTEDSFILARALRTIRSGILASVPTSDNIVLLITSAMMDEGKSFISRELAWAFAALENRRTLLIDADFRRITPMDGLRSVPKHTLADLMLRTNLNEEIDLMVPELGYEYLPARPLDIDPSDLFSSQRFDELIEGLRKEFDIIIIDGPPVLPVPDSINIARCVDMTVFAVRYDNTLVSKVVEGLTRLRSAAVTPIAGVLSRTVHKNGDQDGYLEYLSIRG